MAGYNDTCIDASHLIGCKLPVTMSLALKSGCEETYCLNFRITKNAMKILDKTNCNFMVNLYFEDLLGNRICLPIRVDTSMGMVMGTEEQKYVVDEIQRLVELSVEKETINVIIFEYCKRMDGGTVARFY